MVAYALLKMDDGSLIDRRDVGPGPRPATLPGAVRWILDSPPNVADPTTQMAQVILPVPSDAAQVPYQIVAFAADLHQQNFRALIRRRAAVLFQQNLKYESLLLLKTIGE